MEELLKLVDGLSCSNEAKGIYKNILILSANFSKQVAVLVPIKISYEFHNCSRFLDDEIKKHTSMVLSHSDASVEGRINGVYLWGYVGLTNETYGFHKIIREMISQTTPIESVSYLVV